MPLTRRTFLAATGATLAARPGFSADIPELRAVAGMAQLLSADYPATPVWTFGGMVPGPELRLKRGDTFARRVVNALDVPTSVHWHGLRVPNAMDGVPELTQKLIEPGGAFDYSFAAGDAGTYWYHSHNRTWEQLARGLAGPFIVEEDTPPEVDTDVTLAIDDWRLTEDGTLHESFGALHDWAHGGRLGNWVTVNGEGHFKRPVKQGERLRLRLINTSNARIYQLVLRGMEASIVALDGQPLDMPQAAGTVTLAPAQRVDLIADITAEQGETALLAEEDAEGLLGVADFPVDGVARMDALPPVVALPPNDVPDPGPLNGAATATLRMDGGAMGAMMSASLRGRQMDMRALAEEGYVWSMNGMADMPDAPLIEVDRGATVRLTLRNETAWPHAMHIHGHHFRRITPTGLGALRDTYLMAPRETAEIAFVADNPGDWLVHCHMVEHAASGMMTWLRVG